MLAAVKIRSPRYRTPFPLVDDFTDGMLLQLFTTKMARIKPVDIGCRDRVDTNMPGNTLTLNQPALTSERKLRRGSLDASRIGRSHRLNVSTIVSLVMGVVDNDAVIYGSRPNDSDQAPFGIIAVCYCFRRLHALSEYQTQRESAKEPSHTDAPIFAPCYARRLSR
jgi:hypothetical protein